MKIPAVARRAVKRLAKELGWLDLLRAKRAAKRSANSTEPEMRLLGLFLRGRPFVDVGANQGMYSAYALTRGVGSVVAVEPVPDLAELLRHRLRRHGSVIEGVLAASDEDVTLHIPEVAGAQVATRSSIEPPKAGEPGQTLTVRSRTLDSLQIGADAVIKVDVEGAEESVLAGASDLLARGGPVVWLIEAEERQSDGVVQRLTRTMEAAGYQGWLAMGCELVSAARFDVALHQSPAHVAELNSSTGRPFGYANNVVFVRDDNVEMFLEALPSAAFRLQP